MIEIEGSVDEETVEPEKKIRTNITSNFDSV